MEFHLYLAEDSNVGLWALALARGGQRPRFRPRTVWAQRPCPGCAMEAVGRHQGVKGADAKPSPWKAKVCQGVGEKLKLIESLASSRGRRIIDFPAGEYRCPSAMFSSRERQE